jgi:hypothetical protein
MIKIKKIKIMIKKLNNNIALKNLNFMFVIFVMKNY